MTFDIFDCFLTVCRDEAKRWIKLAGIFSFVSQKAGKKLRVISPLTDIPGKRDACVSMKGWETKVKKLFDVNLSPFFPFVFSIA